MMKADGVSGVLNVCSHFGGFSEMESRSSRKLLVGFLESDERAAAKCQPGREKRRAA